VCIFMKGMGNGYLSQSFYKREIQLSLRKILKLLEGHETLREAFLFETSIGMLQRILNGQSATPSSFSIA
jgi:hypothetical protein